MLSFNVSFNNPALRSVFHPLKDAGIKSVRKLLRIVAVSGHRTGRKLARVTPRKAVKEFVYRRTAFRNSTRAVWISQTQQDFTSPTVVASHQFDFRHTRDLRIIRRIGQHFETRAGQQALTAAKASNVLGFEIIVFIFSSPSIP